MADTSAYTALQNTLQQLQAQLDAANSKYNQLQSDDDYTWIRQVINDPRVVSTYNGWISDKGKGTFWQGEDARQARDNGINYVNSHYAKIKAQADLIADLRAKIKTAEAAVLNYEKNSPVVAAQVESEKTKKVMIIAGIVLFVVMILGIVIAVVVRNKRKGAAPAAAAV